MIAWIFASEEYTSIYHEYFAEFVEKYFANDKLAKMIDDTKALIAPYVQKDPTAFCSYEEFEKGVVTLRGFCLLRAESVAGQLNGTISSTTQTQESSTLVDASFLNISDMGSMGFGGGKGGFGGGKNDFGGGRGDLNESQGGDWDGQMPDFGGDWDGRMPDFGDGQIPNFDIWQN